MKVLSIDFDYFQNTKKEQISLFPDGVDNSTFISEIIWGDHYATYGDELNSIGIMEDELEALKRLLMKQSKRAKVMICNSHKHIFDFVFKYIKKEENIQLVNIDMHHDMINDNKKLDCGNWISFMIKAQQERKAKLSFEWIANPISLDVYGIEDLFQINFKDKSPVLPSIKAIENNSYDLIFLCRSDIWLPPHLDCYFTEIYDLIAKKFSNVVVEKGIETERCHYKQVAEEVKAIKEKHMAKPLPV